MKKVLLILTHIFAIVFGFLLYSYVLASERNGSCKEEIGKKDSCAIYKMQMEEILNALKNDVESFEKGISEKEDFFKRHFDILKKYISLKEKCKENCKERERKN